MTTVRSRSRCALEALGLGGLLVALGCTPSFQEGESDAGAGGEGGAGKAGRAGAAAGRSNGGSGGSGAGVPGSGGSAPEAGRGGSAQGGGHAEDGGTGGMSAVGGQPMQGGAQSSGGTDALGGTGGTGGTGALGGADAQGGTGAQGGAGPEGGTGPLLGGSAGTSSAAGRGGAAGAPNVPKGCTSPLVIDDMEDGDQLTCASDGRSGDWWTALGPVTATIDPPTNEDFAAFALGADARSGSKYGMHLAGEGFGHSDDDWASLGFFLAGGDAYSLDAYQGLAFYAKASVDLTIHVTLATAITTPTSEGGDCEADCNDHYAFPAELTTTWQEFSIPFADLAQEGWGEKPKDLAHTLFVYFGYVGPDGGATTFDFLVDDLRLY